MSLKEKLRDIQFAIFDFDGTMTDGFVFVDQDGRESVRCSRRDGLGIGMLKGAGISVQVLSKEANPVVIARCRKLGIECASGIDDKGEYLRKKFGDVLGRVLYMGDDLNDLECIRLAGIGVSPADGHPECQKEADYIASRPGGAHAVREVCDLLLDARS